MESLRERILKHHKNDVPTSASGHPLIIQQMEELVPGVIGVIDNTDELDLFVDTTILRIVSYAVRPYSAFLPNVSEAQKIYSQMSEKYQMICVVEDRWNPYFRRHKATFEEAKEASEAYFTAK